jgi:hypothetical protein
MKYPWPAAIAILLSAGAANIADAMTYKDIAGQWCGDVTDYVYAEYVDREISRRQTGEYVQDHEVHLHQRQRTY